MRCCKVLIGVNTAWNLFNFRAGLIRAMVAQGFEVVAVAPFDNYVSNIQMLGCRYVPLVMDNKGTNPLRDALLTWRFLRLFIRERPDVYLGYTIKPNVYGSLAAHVLRIPVINNISGLGTVFMRNGWLLRFVSWLYRQALRQSAKVFFQNKNDRQLLIAKELVRPEVSDVLPGSGVNIEWFTPDFVPKVAAQSFSSSSYDAGQHGPKKSFRFLLTARLLWDKGVGEFVEAARQLRAQGVDAEFQLLGFLDVANQSAILRDTVDIWIKEGVIQYLGEAVDVRPMIAQADCIVLPSYREGIPRSLLEAAAMAKPIITTDTVGCRNVVVNGETGFLCKPKDAKDLADKMLMMFMLTRDELSIMGKKGREFIVREFDEKIVIDQYLNAINNIIERN